mgnify:CR=1 FL=1
MILEIIVCIFMIELEIKYSLPMTVKAVGMELMKVRNVNKVYMCGL